MPDRIHWDDLFNQAFDHATPQLGHANILIAGRSGVGKSTLINTVFRGDFAEVGQGRPVTRETREYSREGYPLTILDTRGLEMQDYRETTEALAALIKQRRHDPDPAKHLHVAWVCIAEDSRRVEEGESHLVSRLDEVGLPIVGVITKARADGGFRSEVQQLLPQAGQVVRVRARSEQFDDGHELPVMGLEQLVEATSEVLPEGIRNAFAAAQKVSVELKVQRARNAVRAASVAAGTVAANPIPFSDALLLAPLQVGMLATITQLFGIPVGREFLATLLTSVLGVSATTFGGRLLATNLLKLLPGGGTLAAGVIASGTAVSLTAALGETYVAALRRLVMRGEQAPSKQEVAAAFKEEWEHRAAATTAED